MRKNAYMLIHELRDETWGKYAELMDNAKSNVEIMKTLKAWYADRTKIKPEQLDKILERDIWWNAATCKKYGLVDDII
jgi:ATP-dependent protease ClpP protease subunit